MNVLKCNTVSDKENTERRAEILKVNGIGVSRNSYEFKCKDGERRIDTTIWGITVRIVILRTCERKYSPDSQVPRLF